MLERLLTVMEKAAHSACRSARSGRRPRPAAPCSSTPSRSGAGRDTTFQILHFGIPQFSRSFPNFVGDPVGPGMPPTADDRSDYLITLDGKTRIK